MYTSHYVSGKSQTTGALSLTVTWKTAAKWQQTISSGSSQPTFMPSLDSSMSTIHLLPHLLIPLLIPLLTGVLTGLPIHLLPGVLVPPLTCVVPSSTSPPAKCRLMVKCRFHSIWKYRKMWLRKGLIYKTVCQGVTMYFLDVILVL